MGHASIDIVYTKALQQELKNSNKRQSVLAQNIIKKIISKYSYGNAKMAVSHNKKYRSAGVCFDFSLSSVDPPLDIIAEEIKKELPKSVKSVCCYIFDE